MISLEPRVALWDHQYPGLKYFGKLLETFLTASDSMDATTGTSVDRDATAEIIEIFASLLLSISKSSPANANSRDDARNVLETASSGLNRNRDIITVVFDIFEEELSRQSAVSGSDVPLCVLVSCVHFIHALIPISPDRVYPLLSRTGLLGIARGEGKLLTVVEGVELVTGRYEFLISCVRLYESLVEDVASNAIRRRSRVKASARFNGPDEGNILQECPSTPDFLFHVSETATEKMLTPHSSTVGTGVPDHLLSKIILTFTRYLIDVLESSFSWKFVTENDRRCLNRSISTSFDRVLRYVFGVEATISE